MVTGNNTFKTSLFDKRKQFPFQSIRFPHNDSLLYVNTKLNVAFNQSLRIAKICNNRNDFVDELKSLIRDFKDRNYKTHFILKQFIKAFNRFPFHFKYICNSSDEFKNLLDNL